MSGSRWDGVAAGALALSGSILLSNLLRFRRPGGALPTDPPLVSILVPARNEAHNIEACVRSLLQQRYPAFELLVLDDRSEDGTGDVLRRLAATQRVAAKGQGHPFIVLEGKPLPAGWGGKNWACQQLFEHANPSSRFLLFTDADTVHAPDTLRLVVSEAVRGDVGLLSLMPEQQVESWAEQCVVTLLPLQILGYLPLIAAERVPWPSLAAANGQFMLFERSSYIGAGGHGARPLGLAEDVTLAQRVKAYGGRVWLMNGVGLVRCRMYRNRAEVVAGFRRSFAGGFRLNAPVTGGIMLFNALGYLLPFLRTTRVARHLALVVLLLRALLAWRTKAPLRSVLAHPLGMVILLGAQGGAALDALSGRDTQWKGRRYSHQGAEREGG